MRRRTLTLASLTLALLLAGSARQALAVAEVHKFNVVLSAMPTFISGGDFKEDLDFVNQNFIEAVGLEGLDPITYGWMYEAELRYMVRPSWAAHVGVAQMKVATKREYLPALGVSVQLYEEIRTVPIMAGASYYFQPYNQGDFQARAYLGGGAMGVTTNRVTQTQTVSSNGASTGGIAGAGSFENKWDAMSPGWFAEGGVHMFFASRFSVLIGANYRSAKVRNQLYEANPSPALINAPVYSLSSQQPYELDLSGIGMRMAVAIGF